MPKNDDVRNAADAGIAVGQVDPVDQHHADDLAEGERHDREIVAAQPQDRKAENDAPHRREHSGERQADPERQAEGRRQQRVGIGADRVKGDVAEIEQAGEADHDVQSPAQHHVDQDLDAVIVDPLQRAAGPEQAEQMSGKQDDEAEHERAELAPERERGRRDGGAVPSPSRAACTERAAHAAGGDRADAVEPDAPVRRDICRRKTKAKTSAAIPNDSGQRAGQDEFVVDVRFGVIADDRERRGRRRRARQRRRCGAPERSRRGGRFAGGGDLEWSAERAVMFRPSPLRAGRGCRRA